ncbi:MAG: class I SAM-dependent methyltransferase [Acidimicrobiia bacterium]|nr:class I SAM-dependent methyltransferase [Acidimicrobiia bacterium]
MSIIPFYGAENREMFAIERMAMDRPGLVIDHLNAALPNGPLLDIGAGDGFTADALNRPGRTMVGIEPAVGMFDQTRSLMYVRGSAEALPFRDEAFNGAYASWAYFFPGHLDISPGLAEAQRVVRPGGPLVVVDNYGGDEFSGLLSQTGVVDRGYWEGQGFEVEQIETVFEFSSPADAKQLMSFYAGKALSGVPTVISYRVAVMTKTM